MPIATADIGTPPEAASGSSIDALIDSTPDTRDRYIDFLRGLAILAVAIGHWLVVVPTFENGRFDGFNALETVPLMRSLTWVFQVMPLFFVVGGFANAVSWRSAKSRGQGWSTWVRGRYRRLLAPTLAFVSTWVVAGALLRAFGVDPRLVHMMAWLAVVPLWFLAVYVLVVALAPPMLRLHDRLGVFVPITLAVATSIVDYLRIARGMESFAYVNFLFVFLFCQQLGFFWRDGKLGPKRLQLWLMLVSGISVLWLLTHLGPYPPSLVGVPGEEIQNNAPPTATFLALGVAQCALALLAREPVNRWLQRRRPWSAVIMINAHALTIHVWHFTSLIVVALALLPTGIVPNPEHGTMAWWLIRLATLPVLTVPLVALVWIFGRLERAALARSGGSSTDEASIESLSDSSATGWDAALTVVATISLLVAFSLTTIRGLSVVDAPWGLPIVGLCFLAVGAAISHPLQVGPRQVADVPRRDGA